ncbi:hypothetical protein H7X69_02610, partial [Candidatus Saccharibacteria bacterium]|nr:hypothetical protein [Candidatus Saccharibacteria bacterium]
HTSHVTLVGLLLVVGIFMYVSAGFARVQAEQSGTVPIGAIVPGPAPTVGATITSPINGVNMTNQQTIEVTGTCAPGTFVVVQNNKQLVGSTVCTDAGIFLLQIQLQTGVNVLSALNYDNLDQPGPSTPLVSINLVTTSAAIRPLQPLSSVLPVVLPSNPSIIPGVTPEVSSCDTQKKPSLPVGGEHQVAIVCVPRFIQANTQYTLGFWVWGGLPPYAASVHLGEGADDVLLSIANPGVKTVKFSYVDAGTYTIIVNTTDKNGNKATVQTAVQVSGETRTPLAVLTNDLIGGSWFKTPVPLYLVAVAITLGFWGGDIFDRNFGASKRHPRARKTV